MKIAVPYYSQRSNAENPSGSCNATAIAMVLEHYGITLGDRTADEVYRALEVNGDPGLPENMADFIRAQGLRDKFSRESSWEDLKAHIGQGDPAIVHGYFTGAGHIVTIVGFNAEGWVCHDPWGEYCDGGYLLNDGQNSTRGKFITYSYALMCRLCGESGDLWLHLISKG